MPAEPNIDHELDDLDEDELEHDDDREIYGSGRSVQYLALEDEPGEIERRLSFDARVLPTSTLLELATNPDAIMQAIDPDGEIERMEDEPGGVRRARELLEQRGRFVAAAIAAELDRRIPIPKGEG